MKKAVWATMLTAALMLLIVAAGVAFGAKYGAPPGRAESGSVSAEESSAAGLASAGDGSEETVIRLEGDRIEVSGPGASASGHTVSITRAGRYSISGALEDGQISVNAGSNDTVVLALNGMEISHAGDAAIYVKNAGQVILVLEDGTVNQVRSGTPIDLAAIRDGTNGDVSGGAIYSRDDLSITGGGTLRVFGYLNNGIQTSNRLMIENGEIEVTALNNAIKGKDAVEIRGGAFSIRSGGDGIKSDDTTGEDFGVVSITGGSFSITSDSDGIQAETALTISGGDFAITTGGGCAAAVRPRGGWGNRNKGWDMEEESSVSAKGLKSGVTMQITGGTFSIDAKDDALHSNGSIQITGGSFAIATGDDGIHADTELSVEGGEILIADSYEGLEANQIRLSGGTIDVVAADDGVNAYGGRRSWGGGKTTEETPNLYFLGAAVTIDADGDGIDSNANIYVEGGSVIINGPTSSGNGAIDYGRENGGVCLVNGGVVLAVGSSGMAETFDGSSGQCSFRYNFERPFDRGSRITISDAQGNILMEHTAVKRGESVVFSCPELTVGQSYTLTVDRQSVEIVQDSVSTSLGRAPRWGW